MAYRATPRTEARKRAAREQIVSAALELVAEGGYRSAGIQAVASRGGVATGTVYRHFDSKAALFAEVFRRASQRELDVVREIASRPGTPVSVRLAAGAEAFARRALAGPVLAYALLAEPVDPAVEAERLRFRRGYRDGFARLLEEGVASGELEPMDTETVAAALVGALAEALVGPLSPGFGDGRAGSTPKARDRGSPPGARDKGSTLGARDHESLVAGLVQFCLNAINERTSDVGHLAHA